MTEGETDDAEKGVGTSAATGCNAGALTIVTSQRKGRGSGRMENSAARTNAVPRLRPCRVSETSHPPIRARDSRLSFISNLLPASVVFEIRSANIRWLV